MEPPPLPEGLDAPDSTPKDPPGWYSPGRLLALFCTINLVTYLDRGVIASNGVNGSQRIEGAPGTGIQGDFGLNDFQDGVLPAAFMVGLLVASPIFAHMSQATNPFRLIAVGLTVWTLAVVGCAGSRSFAMIMGSRMLVGVGEASFVSLAAPFIDDSAPPASKTKWLAAFYMCIPVGVALGYVFGGAVAAAWGWRAAFWLEAGMMLPFVCFSWVAPPIALRGCGQAHEEQEPELHEGTEAEHLVVDAGGSQRSEAEASALGRLCAAAGPLAKDTREVLSHRVYLWITLGATFYTATIGAFAFWGPKAGLAAFPTSFSSPDQADTTFGAVTVLAGVLGTGMGGLALDRLGASVRTALQLCVGCVVAGCVGVVVAFSSVERLEAFMILFGVAEMMLFATQAPINAAVLWVVPAHLRSFAMALLTMSVHALGDVPSPPLLGLLQDHAKCRWGTAGGWRVTMSVASMLLVPCGLCWMAAWRAARTARDYRDGGARAEVEEGGPGVPEDSHSITEALLHRE